MKLLILEVVNIIIKQKYMNFHLTSIRNQYQETLYIADGY